MKSTMGYLIQKKVDQYNRADDNANTKQAREYLTELRGMQQILETMGIELSLDYDKEFHLIFSIAFT